jgi:rhodanese-related sulfurtransferase
MKKTLKILGITFIAFVGPTAWSMMTLAEDDAPTNTNPYMVIAEKNIFHLQPPPPPDTTTNAPEPEKPKVILSGFATVAGVTTAFMSIPAKDAKDHPTYMRLKLGEAQDNIQLLDVREPLGEVDIVDAGAQITLSLKSNSYAMTPTAPTPTKAASGAPMFARPLPRRLNGPPNPGAPFMPAPSPPVAVSSETDSHCGESVIIAGGKSTDMAPPQQPNN